MSETLVGTWTYTKAVKKGETKTAAQLDGQTANITPKTWTLNGEGGKFVMDYRLDTNATPNKITFTITESPFGEGMTTGGLTKMVGDELVVRYSPEGGDAPNNFDAKADDDYHTFHLKKQ